MDLDRVGQHRRPRILDVRLEPDGGRGRGAEKLDRFLDDGGQVHRPELLPLVAAEGDDLLHQFLAPVGPCYCHFHGIGRRQYPGLDIQKSHLRVQQNRH